MDGGDMSLHAPMRAFASRSAFLLFLLASPVLPLRCHLYHEIWEDGHKLEITPDICSSSRYCVSAIYRDPDPVKKNGYSHGCDRVDCDESDQMSSTVWHSAPGGLRCRDHRDYGRRGRITDGVWQKPVNLSACFSGDHRRDTIISVEIRDKGKGSRGESAVILDPLAPGFEIVPLRALFNERTKDILIKTNSNGATNGAMLGVTFHCLGDVAQSSKNAETYVGEVFVFPKPTDWGRCHVIMVQLNSEIAKKNFSRLL
ncbi:hypothetical protein NECAME_01909 [Necator americanus]|uniref:Uncharacterized protein n=1 Tax=Necator americanus TaxID=51031 RepID=W2TLW4_NECAM|nr:hypothetical protein NECAME_01909 [Necator americanus]ETN82624.1 hypothetical protein NECAME_01909 [Necator americanus]